MYGGIARARPFSTEIVEPPFDLSRQDRKSLIFTLLCNKEKYIILKGTANDYFNQNVYMHIDVGTNSNAITLLKSDLNLVLCL